MPKPLLLQRPSGLYVRFLLPLDIRPLYGARFIVRSLHGLRGDEARWQAACLGYALSQALGAVRKRRVDVDTKKLVDDALAAAAGGGIIKYDIRTPSGFSIRAEGAEDHARAMEMLDKIGTIALPAAPPEPSSRSAHAEVSVGPSLHQSIARFLEQFEQKDRAEATVDETFRTLLMFRDLIADVPMKDVGTTQTDEFLSCLKHWPARAGVKPKYRGLSTREIVEMGRKDPSVRGVGSRTVDKHLDRLRVFFNNAVKRDELGANPLAGERMQSSAQKHEESRRSFTPTELLRVFDQGLRAQHTVRDPHYFWVPVLMLFTGARMNEIVYLNVDDVDEVNGIVGLHLTKAKGGKMKNASAVRYVPLPAVVLEMGLRDYAVDVRKAGFVHLFPGGSEEAKNGRGDHVSKWFNRTYLRKACGIEDAEVCLQAFRNTFMSRADRVSVSEAQMNPLIGHGPKTIKQRHYIDPPTLPERAANIQKLATSFLVPPLTPYRRGQFDDYLRSVPVPLKRTEASAPRTQRRARSK